MGDEELPFGMGQIGPEMSDDVVTFQEALYVCPKCGKRALKLQHEGIDGISTKDYPKFAKGYFEAQCQAEDCDLSEARDFVVALGEMGTACALATLYKSVGNPL